MGNSCASPKKANINISLKGQLTAKIIHTNGNGSLQEFRQPIPASYVLSQNPNCFLCSSESLHVNCHVPHVPPDEELQLGHIYFLLPLSKSHSLLSLPELCALAIKASQLLAPDTTWFSGRNGGHRFRRVRSAANVLKMDGCRRIKL